MGGYLWRPFSCSIAVDGLEIMVGRLVLNRHVLGYVVERVFILFYSIYRRFSFHGFSSHKVPRGGEEGRNSFGVRGPQQGLLLLLLLLLLPESGEGRDHPPWGQLALSSFLKLDNEYLLLQISFYAF